MHIITSKLVISNLHTQYKKMKSKSRGFCLTLTGKVLSPSTFDKYQPGPLNLNTCVPFQKEWAKWLWYSGVHHLYCLKISICSTEFTNLRPRTEDIHLAACNGIDLLLIRSPTTVLKNQKQQHGKVGVDEITEKLCFEKKLQGEVRSYVSQQRIFQVHVAV